MTAYIPEALGYNLGKMKTPSSSLKAVVASQVDKLICATIGHKIHYLEPSVKGDFDGKWCERKGCSYKIGHYV